MMHTRVKINIRWKRTTALLRVTQNILSLYQLSVTTRTCILQDHTLDDFITYKHDVYIIQIT